MFALFCKIHKDMKHFSKNVKSISIELNLKIFSPFNRPYHFLLEFLSLVYFRLEQVRSALDMLGEKST